MSTIEINKIAGAVLCALLLLLTPGFLAELVAGHPEAGAPAFLPPAAEAPEGGPEGGEIAPEPAAAETAAVDMAAADPAAGARAFRRCAACHNAEPGAGHKIGPNLWGVAGAPQAAREGFRYSAVLSGLGGVWDDAALDSFLADPRAYAPATKMAFAGVSDPVERAALIAYLRTLADGE